MKKLLAIALLIIPITIRAQSPVEYDVSFDNAVHHEARISVTWRDIGDAPLQMRMSRSSPGRYAIHEFAKNVYQVSVVDGQGNPLTVYPAEPLPVGRCRSRWYGDGDLYLICGPGRWNLLGNRSYTRTPEHAGDLHVGSRIRRSVDHGDLPSRGRELESSHTISTNRRRFRIRCAKFAVFPGQSDGTQQFFGATLGG